jgi:hypothetical protein
MNHQKTYISVITAVVVILGAVACEPTVEEVPEEVVVVQTQPVQDCAPWKELSEMDHRRPVPLQPMMAWHQKQNMNQHLIAIQRITAGLANEDWEEVAAASSLIESSPEMSASCEHMGAGADGFTELALDFHRRADAIGEAAGQEDMPATLAATSHTLDACTSCHATYRQEVVDLESWQALTDSSDDPTQMHHGGHAPMGH